MAAARFNVVLEVDLTKAQKETIQKNINATVAKSLLQMDFKSNAWGSKVIKRKDWYGKWLRLFKTERALTEAVTFRPDTSF